MATTTLGGTTLPNPYYGTEGFPCQAEEVGTQFVMADGAIRTHTVGVRRRWHLSWRGVSSAERDTLYTKYKVRAAQTLKLPDSATTYSVTVVPGTWKQESETYLGGQFTYHVSFELREVNVA